MTIRTFTAAGEAMTPVPTAFLADHMLSAPSDYVKVYLYGLYLSSNPAKAQGVQMESSLHMKASDIDAALRYWEHVGLVRLGDDGSVRYVFAGSAASAEEPYPYVAFNLQVADVLGRDPSASELTRCYEWLKEYDFPREVVLTLIRHCIDVKGKRVSFNYMDKCAADWASKDIDCIEAAEAYVELYHRRRSGAKQLLTDMGITRRDPDVTELELYDKWTNEWGFSHDGIRWAMRGKEFNMSAPFKYLDQILSGFHERDAHRAQDIETLSKQKDSERAEIKQVLAKVGLSESVSRPQEELYRKWRRMGFSLPVILEACGKIASRGPRGERLQQVDALLDSWHSKGTVSEAAVKNVISEEAEVDKKVREVFDAASIDPVPIKDSDRRLYTWYTGTNGMDHDVLLYAADLSSIQKEPRQYMGRILQQWAKSGVKTLDEARRAAELHEQMRQQGGTRPAEQPYAQRSYSAADAEQHAYRVVQDLEAQYGQS